MLVLVAAAPLRQPTLTARDGSQIALVTPGKWLLVNYWATTCRACRREFPVLAALSHRRDLTVLGLSDEMIDGPRWTAFLAAHPFPYPVALVDDGMLPAQIRPFAFFLRRRPMSYLIRPNGRVARRFLGDLTQRTVVRLMQSAPK